MKALSLAASRVRGPALPLLFALGVTALLLAALAWADHRSRNPPPLVAPATPFSLDQWQR